MDGVPYGLELMVGLLRVSVVALVSFVLFTRAALPGPPKTSSWEGRGWGDAVLGVSATVVAASALGVLGLLDTMSLATTLALALAGGAVLRYRRVWRRTLLLTYADGLRWLERLVPPGPIAPGADDPPSDPVSIRALLVPDRPRSAARSVDPQQATAMSWRASVGVVAVVAIGVRLIPAFAEPAPFTLRFYASLETLKGLMVGAPTGSEGGWGLPALALALSEMARVEPSLVLRGAGAVAAGAVTYGVWKTVRFYWGGPVGAFAGALLVAVGGPLLAVPIERQAGAEPLLLAAALALPVFPHLAAYVGDGNRRGISVGLVGLMATGLVYPAVGALLAALVGLHVLAIVVQVRVRRALGGQRRGHYRDRGLVRRAGLLLGAGAAFAGAWRGYVLLLDTLGLEGSVFFFENADVAVALPGAVALVLGGLLVVAPIVPGRSIYSEMLPRPGALVRNGAQTLGLLAVWVGTGGDLVGVSGGAAVLLTCSVAIAAGLLVNEVYIRVVEPLRILVLGVGRAPVWAPSAVALAAAFVVVTTGWGVPVPGPPVEPAGFVEAFQDIADHSIPYTWTVVSHNGIGLRARHRGRFMDYEYFLQNFDAGWYSHHGRDAIPTPDVYLFLERGRGPSLVREELRPSGRRHSERLRTWVDTYARRDDLPATLTVVYRDDEVEVLRLGRPAGTLLEVPADLVIPGAPAPIARADAR
ncbi:hypothetical protein [Rubrivirga sp. IMCC45206]|uniref:hypothetical protein n=1 Tax=Rubrivirga sp. IMCC45206 TaxID=3391614 RepID=UPI00398FFF7A